MIRKRSLRQVRFMVLLALAMAAGGSFAGAAVANRDGQPSSSSTSDADGAQFIADLPDQVPVLGNGGEVVGYVDKGKAFGPPTFDRNGNPVDQGPLEVRDESGRAVGRLGVDGFVPDSGGDRPSPPTSVVN